MKSLFLFFVISTSLWAGQLECKTPHLHTDWQPWSQSSDFSTLIFEGDTASQIFQGFGQPGARYFSVILRNEWCQFIQDAVICETPKEALAEVETASSASTAPTVHTLRYFLMILNYKADGWAFLKVRAKRMDDAPPLLFHTELPAGSCSASS